MNRVTAILITYHPDDSVVEAIHRLTEQVDYVIVVDNSATLQTRDLLTHAFALEAQSVALHFNTTNRGVAAALNLGVETALQRGAEWVLTMDQDSRVTSGMVASMFSAYAALPPDDQKLTASLSPILLPDILDTNNDTASPPECSVVPTAITSGNLVKITAWQAVGGFNERLFIDYVDHEFCFRMRQAGWQIRECPAARLIHQIGNATTIRFFGRTLTIDQHPPLRMYYIVRNGFYFWHTFPEPCAFTRADKMNTSKLFLKTLLFDTHKRERLIMSWRGYRDYRRNRFGDYAAHYSA